MTDNPSEQSPHSSDDDTLPDSGAEGVSDSPEELERIEELESQVSELSALVEILLAKPENARHLDQGDRARHLPHTADELLHPLMDGVRMGMGKMLGVEEGETIESRLGSVWLTRITVVLFMTVLVLGVGDDNLIPLHKIAVGYAIAVGAIAYGWYKRSDTGAFPQAIFGTGLSTLYFTTYAAMLLPSTQLVTDAAYAPPVLIGVLLAIAAMLHIHRSETAAGISVFLIYYTVVLSLNQGLGNDSLVYALVTGSLLAVLALAFHVTHQWLFFTWAALLATYAVYVYFFVLSTPVLNLSQQEYFGWTSGFLLLCYAVFALASITDHRKSGARRRTVIPMAILNSLLCFGLLWNSVHQSFPEYDLTFRWGFTGLTAFVAGVALITGPRRNHFYQLYSAKTVLLFSYALSGTLPREWMLVSLAGLCLALAITHRVTGLVMYKALGLIILVVTFVGTLFAIPDTTLVEISSYEIQANWFACVGVTILFTFSAWFYEHFVWRIPPEERVAAGQWVLADSRWDMNSGAVAMLYTASSALILTAVSILDLGGIPSLPFILAAQGVTFGVLGILLRTPQVEITSVLLLIGSHISFHFFWLNDQPGFETQDNYIVFTLLVAWVTFCGGYLWERYLRRIEGGTQFEHDALGSVPYLAGTLLIVTIIERNLNSIHAPIAHGLVGTALMLASVLTFQTGLRVSAIVAFLVGTGSFGFKVYNEHIPQTVEPYFLGALMLLVLCYAMSERFMLVWEKHTGVATYGSEVLRTAFVIVAAILGAAGLWEWAPVERLTLYVLALAVLMLSLGIIFKEQRYRIAALFILFGLFFRLYAYDLRNTGPLLKISIFAVVVATVSVISWGYSIRRNRKISQSRGVPGQVETSASDG